MARDSRMHHPGDSINKLAAIGSCDNALFTIVSWRCILKKHHSAVQVGPFKFNKDIDIFITKISFNIFSKSVINTPHVNN